MLSRRDHGSQAGFSLIETLVALMLVSVVVLALAAGMFTLLRTTDVTSRSQRMQAALTTAAESVKAMTYTPCATAASYALPSDLSPDFTARVTTVEYWNGTPVLPASPASTTVLGAFVDSLSSCPASDLAAQRVTVEVTMKGDVRTAEVVKRRAPGVTP